LKKQVGDRYEIFPKVRLADFIDIDVDKYKDKMEGTPKLRHLF
jgi:hypothetical protein